MTKGASGTFVTALGQESTDLNDLVETGKSIGSKVPKVTKGHADELHQAVRQARDWQELSAALERAQAAFERGQVIRDQAEELAVLAAQTAHKLSGEAH